MICFFLFYFLVWRNVGLKYHEYVASLFHLLHNFNAVIINLSSYWLPSSLVIWKVDITENVRISVTHSFIVSINSSALPCCNSELTFFLRSICEGVVVFWWETDREEEIWGAVLYAKPRVPLHCHVWRALGEDPGVSAQRHCHGSRQSGQEWSHRQNHARFVTNSQLSIHICLSMCVCMCILHYVYSCLHSWKHFRLLQSPTNGSPGLALHKPHECKQL